jgi:hypothetical protein
MSDDSPDTATDQLELADLRWHWDTAYDIDVFGNSWTATFKGDTTVLSAPSADELRDLIRGDYRSRKSAGAAGGHGRTAGREVGPGESALRRLINDEIV